MTPTQKPSEWGRWHWPSGLGRWHAIAGAEGAAVKLACGRVRKPPKVTAGRPGNEACCPKCMKIDDLRLGYQPEQADTDLPVYVPALVGAGAARGRIDL